MSRYFDDRTFASDPGSITLSLSCLHAFKSQLGLIDRIFFAGRKPDGYFEEHLRLADSRAAIVVGVEPDLRVAAYSDDIDAVTILRFPRSFVPRYSLTAGTKLLTVNSYWHRPSTAKADEVVAPDLVAGPHYRHWYNFTPLIAQFLCESPHQVAWKMASIGDDEFTRAMTLASEYTQRFPQRSRNGNPYLCNVPA